MEIDMTLAQQFKEEIDICLEGNEWYDGETEIAQSVVTNKAKNMFKGMGFFRGNEVHFNDGSKVVRSGLTVHILGQ